MPFPRRSLLIAGSLVLLALLLSLTFPLFQPKPSDWYTFVMQKRLKHSSPANMGKIVLDAPAGKHGFLKARKGAFYFEDGTQARFWGTNLVFSSCFPSKGQARLIADRLAFFGFNAVRLHHMDAFFEPDGIFKDTCPACQDPQDKKTGILSPKQLDRLDYLIYELKKRGIYININLLVSRRFTRADGVKNAEELKAAAKPVSLFDPKLIALQKQYAKNLLTHTNPYTKLRYCDDPAVALVEITNENSIFHLKRKKIPWSYFNDLNARWEKFCEGKKASLDELKKSFYLSLEKAYVDQMMDFLKKECEVKVPVTGIGGYDVAETLAGMVKCDFIDTHSYWDHPRFPNIPWDGNDFRIRNKSLLLNDDRGIIGQIIEREPRNNKPYTVSEWNHCYPNEYAYETPVLVAYEAAKRGWDGLFQFAYSHNLLSLAKPGDIRYYFDTTSNPQQLVLASLASYVFHHNKAPYKTTLARGIFTLSSPFTVGASGFIKSRALAFDAATLTSGEDGAVFLYAADDKPLGQSNKVILVCVSTVKNKNSGWKNDRFSWGGPPTLLKKMDVRVSLKGKEGFRVYSLDGKGARKKRIKTAEEDGRLVFSTKDADSCWFEISRRSGAAAQ